MFFKKKILIEVKSVQQEPDSQRQPLGPNQMEWIKKHYSGKFFRNPEAGPMVDIS